jgi:hypothetical protein
MTTTSSTAPAAQRPTGLSAFVRCKNEEEFIVASLLSAYRVFDEIVVILNQSTDRTRELVADLLTDHPKIRLLEYPDRCQPIGPGYIEGVRADPAASLARYYNWCLAQTTFSHVCKWDGDMVATPDFERVRAHVPKFDVVFFDGMDAIGQPTTGLEPRIFKFDPARARYVDWDLYEVLEHDYSEMTALQQKCYLHMKLVKREWVHKTWSSPNLSATRSAPDTGVPKLTALQALDSRLRRAARRVLRRTAGGAERSNP